jgi:hypothetical protein
MSALVGLSRARIMGSVTRPRRPSRHMSLANLAHAVGLDGGARELLAQGERQTAAGPRLRSLSLAVIVGTVARGGSHAFSRPVASTRPASAYAGLHPSCRDHTHIANSAWRATQSPAARSDRPDEVACAAKTALSILRRCIAPRTSALGAEAVGLCGKLPEVRRRICRAPAHR